MIIKKTSNKIIKSLASSKRKPVIRQKPKINSNQGKINANDVSRKESQKYEEN